MGTLRRVLQVSPRCDHVIAVYTEIFSGREMQVRKVQDLLPPPCNDTGIVRRKCVGTVAEVPPRYFASCAARRRISKPSPGTAKKPMHLHSIELVGRIVVQDSLTGSVRMHVEQHVVKLVQHVIAHFVET